MQKASESTGLESAQRDQCFKESMAYVFAVGIKIVYRRESWSVRLASISNMSFSTLELATSRILCAGSTAS